MTLRERANFYAKSYGEHERMVDYLFFVERQIGQKFVQEAQMAWEAIDQWEGEYRL